MVNDDVWLMQKHGVLLSDGGLEAFEERVGIKMDNETDLEEARNEAYEELKNGR